VTRILLLDIPKPDDLEWLNSNDRRFRFNKTRLTKAWRRLGYEAILRGSGACPDETLHVANPFAGRVHVVASFWKPTRTHYDPNNLWPTVKAICDGLTDAGLWADDDHEHVIGPDMRHGGYGAARVVLRIEEER
jgi:crossover junction endodeoxyribonuclease RusA